MRRLFGAALGAAIALLLPAAAPALAQCAPHGGYPFVTRGCLPAAELDKALDLSAGTVPPANSDGTGADYGKLWLDESTTPYTLRQCIVAAGCSAAWASAQWKTKETLDPATGAVEIYADSGSISGNLAVGGAISSSQGTLAAFPAAAATGESIVATASGQIGGSGRQPLVSAPPYSVLGNCTALEAQLGACPWTQPAAPNLIPNPGARLAQQHGNASVALASGTAAYTVDGWQAEFVSAGNATDATVACVQYPASSLPAGWPAGLRCTATAASGVSAGDFLAIRVPLSGYAMAATEYGTAGAKSLCWHLKMAQNVEAGLPFAVALTNYAGTRSIVLPQTYGSSYGGAVSQTFSGCFAGDATGTWDIADGSGSAYLTIGLAAGSTFQATSPAWWNGTYYGTPAIDNEVFLGGGFVEVTDLGLYVATAVPQFQLRPLQSDLARVQGRYETSYRLGYVPGTADEADAVSFSSAISGNQKAAFGYAPCLSLPSLTIYSAATGASGEVADITAGTDLAATVYSSGVDYGSISFSPAAAGHLIQFNFAKACKL